MGRTIAERYRIDALLGVGGMGAVFRAHHLGLHRDVAIKVLHPSLGRDPEISARFDREARSASRLDHPNCLQVTDYGTTEHDMKFMVMQLLDGGELTRLLGKPMPAMRALALVLQICRGLEHAHAQGVIHRDVKPENVFITKDHDGQEVLKLVDFGIAKIVGAAGAGDGHRTRAGLIFGTPAYMSPEQAAGLEADERADLYSLGIILYEMLAGKPPFQSDDPVALVRMQVGADPPPLPTEVPPMVAATVERLLAKQREDRFQSARELRDVLEGTLAIMRQDLTPSAEMPSIGSGALRMNSAEMPAIGSGALRMASLERLSPPPPTPTMVRRRPRRRLLVGAGAAGIALATLWMLDSGDEPGSAATPATAPEEAPAADPGAGDEPVTVLAAEGPGVGDLAEVDRLLSAGKIDEAEKLLAPLRDRFPKDAQLNWRHGRVLSKRKGKRAQALAAYGAALDIDPTLLDNPEFFAELRDVMRTPGLRDDALDLALHQLGKYAHPFLLELVNNEKKPLPYDKRHRALDELASVPEDLARVNRQLNIALDLLQARQSLTPCKSYGDALTAMAAAPEYYYLARVQRGEVPKPAPEGSASHEPAEACDGLDARRQTVLDLLATLEPVGDTDGEIVIMEDGGTEPAPAPASGGKPAPKPAPKGGTRKKKDDCSKLRGVFKKKCWQQ
ncbi:MAG: serine/threonine protein kinase [Nannocystaceae bacterium]|nr:serine/threonine protein kinase [Nannocystaceae bacterium]